MNINPLTITYKDVYSDAAGGTCAKGELVGGDVELLDGKVVETGVVQLQRCLQ